MEREKQGILFICFLLLAFPLWFLGKQIFGKDDDAAAVFIMLHIGMFICYQLVSLWYETKIPTYQPVVYIEKDYVEIHGKPMNMKEYKRIMRDVQKFFENN